MEMRQEVQIAESREIEEPDLSLIGSKRSRVHGPLDKMVEEGKLKQTVINEGEVRKWRELAHFYVAQFAYAAGIPFHVFSLPEFDLMCEAIGKHGPGYKGPSEYQLRVPLLKQVYEKVDNDLKKQKETWDEYGCSILTDGWTDRKHRSVMNLCVHCKEGTSFIKSIEDSDQQHTGEYIYKWVEECIKEVGEHKVLQVVTDNHSSNMAAKEMMKVKRPNLFWTSCAAHTIDLMLEDIGKLPRFKKVIEKARSLTVFLYSHHSTLAMMRKFTLRRDIVRPGITRFATSFLTLGSIADKKVQLASMVSSTMWEKNRWSKTAKGIETKATVYSDAFWKDANLLIKIYTPLFKLLRIVDADRRPSMGFVYGMICDAKNEIKAICNRKESVYKPILDIIDKKGKGRLDSILHLGAYYLNPYYYYKDKSVQDDNAIRTALMSCIDIFYPEYDIQDKIGAEEFLAYKNQQGTMGSGMAKRYQESFNGTDNFNPAHWWDFYGGAAPYLRKMAIKILSLTSSSSGCERNWSVFEGIHTKRRNRLDSKRLNNLVFVQFNKRMMHRRVAKTRKGKTKDVLVGNDDSRALHWKTSQVKEKENEEEEEIFPGSGLTWVVVGEASGANEDGIRRSQRTLRRRNARKEQEGYSTALVNVVEGDVVEEVDMETNEEDSDEEVDDFDTPSDDEENDDNVRYDDDDEDE